MPSSCINTVYSIHRVQHTLKQCTPNAASTEDFLSSLHSDDNKLTSECRFSFQHTSLQDWPRPANSSWELKCKFTLSHSHSCELLYLTDDLSLSTQHASHEPLPSTPPIMLDHGLQVHIQSRLNTASKFTQSWPPSGSHLSLDHGLWFHTIIVSKCISNFTWLWPPNASLISLDFGLQVHYPTHLIKASKCMSEYTQSQHPS